MDMVLYELGTATTAACEMMSCMRNTVNKQRLRWLGLVTRKNENMPILKVMDVVPAGESKAHRFKNQFKSDLAYRLAMSSEKKKRKARRFRNKKTFTPL